jgi:hypothetical protein
LKAQGFALEWSNEGEIRGAPGKALLAAPAGGLLGVSALWLTPTSSLQLDVYARALQGCAFHTDALEVRSFGGPSRWFEVDVQPMNGPAGHGGLVVTSNEVTGRKRLEHEVVEVVVGLPRTLAGRDGPAPMANGDDTAFADWMGNVLRREGMTMEVAAKQLGVSVKTSL